MISIIIRTLNEAKHLEKCLHSVSFQNVPHEVIIVDSNSKDETRSVAKKYGCKIIQVPQFTYGKGINIGISNTNEDTELICILSGHCYMLSDNCLKRMSLHFYDKNVAGIYARLMPHNQSSALDTRSIKYIFRELFVPIEDSYFHNAASMLRKSVWESFRFDESLIAGEDMEWSKIVRKEGYKIIYDPNVKVEYLHKETDLDTLKRYSKEYDYLKDFT